MSEPAVIDTANTANIAKNEELLRHLHILDALACDSLAAQFKYFEKAIRNQEAASVIIQLKWIASKKYMTFCEVKRSLLKSADFIDINTLEISNKTEACEIVRRSNITLFFNLLFANFDSSAPDLQNVNVKSFFDYVVPPIMMQSEGIWDLDLNLRVQIYISIIYKNPNKNLYKTMFPKGVEGPPMYTETYVKVRSIIKHFSEDADMLMKEFKWGKFVEEMYKTLSKIVKNLDISLLHKYTSNEASPISSTSSARVVIVENVPRNSNAKKRRLADGEPSEQDQDQEEDNISSDMILGDSFSALKKDEIEQMMLHVDINDNQAVDDLDIDEPKRSQSDLLTICDDEPHTPTLNRRRVTRFKHDSNNRANSDNNRRTISTRKTIEHSSSSLTNMIMDQQSPDERQTSSEESSNSSDEEIEGNSRKRGKKRADHTEGMTKRVKKKKKWTNRELLTLEEGMRQHGKQWAVIKKNYDDKGLKNRTAAQLKDKARSELNRRQREHIDTGVFGIMDL